MKRIFYNTIIFSCILLLCSFVTYKGVTQPDRIKIQFITYNGFGNNLYIDNLMIGQRPVFDIGITGLTNIPVDTFYSAVQDTVIVLPEAKITNFGLTNVSQVQITMNINNISFTSSKDTSINTGSTITITFDTVVIPSDIPLDIRIFSNTADSNSFNDTLFQNSIMLKGASRNVLLEEFTSNTSGSCGINNGFLDNFINGHFDKICAVKYHLGYPPPGNDSMYLHNPVQADRRKNYYNINAVPATILDGTDYISLPYYPDTNMIIHLNKRLEKGSPLSVTVQDERLGIDTIQTTINVNILQNIITGNYRLRILAIERLIYDSIPPGTNGETEFYDVFRYSVTDSEGILIPTTPGNYQFIYSYLKQPVWTDSMIYTIAFVQNENTKEVINCGKGRNYPLKNSKFKNSQYHLQAKPDYFWGNKYKNNFYSSSNILSDTFSRKFKSEIFEGNFPPSGWVLYNGDLSYTFTQVQGFNGPAINGNKSIKIPFYDYGNSGQRDSLITGTFINVSPTDTLSFDYAYAQYLTLYNDSLIVRISIDDGASYSTIFARSGTELSTTQATTLPFAPTSASEWKTFYYPLSQILIPSNIKPETYALFQNFPNPFNPRTTITYQIPKPVFVTLKIYDITGREMKTLVSGEQSRGFYEINFDGNGYASGIYFFVLKTNDFRDAKKMVLIK